MTIQTYGDLQAAVGNWLARGDLAANIPDFITIFEAVANRRLRTRQQESTATLTPTNGVATIPADYLTWRRVTWTGSPDRARIRAPVLSAGALRRSRPAIRSISPSRAATSRSGRRTRAH